MGNILQYIQGSGSYTTDEAKLSPASQIQQNAFIAQNTKAGMTASDKSNISTLLNKILVLARKNRGDIDTMVSNLQVSENLLKQAIDSFENDDTMSSLEATNVSPTILNISNIQYTEYYNFMVEYKYRLSIISYKKLFLKAQLRDLDDKIKTLQTYISTL